ncbi:LysM peptidoglycan-binding domain-containing protein [Paludibacter sp. 221]|uniref:M23 family metallopeptidase n=1 Tax=Paludibacter sp. 221 TaxID=2302939 RepID=UPI0013CF6D87|nr:M23 family metallopeptidase [Paludibacter sp. 221]NDV45583.1 LysM peptidoglycan-binding domain-containing protein [Paludibacter sp. 221]
MFKKIYLALALLTASTSFIKAGDHLPELNVSKLLQDYLDYKHLYDSINVYERMLNDYSDDLMEDHPADDIYRNIWTRERLNPYKIPIDSIPDSIRIDCRNFVLPVPGNITSRFGARRYRYHYGTDLKLYAGEPVKAAFSGKIRIIDYERRGYGHYVVIRHKNGLETVYAHLSKVLVEHNQQVNAGDTIALGGNTGRSTGPHLHFEIRYLGNAINPENIIDFNTGILKEDQYLITKNQTFYYQKEVQALQAAKYIIVRKGDTLSHIASRNGTSVKRICQLNNMSIKSIIRPGQKIRVR